MTEMTALRAHRRGGPEVLTVESAPVPVPAPGEILVAVHAAAITFDELTWEETWTRGGVDRTPTIVSHEVSGVVTRTGSNVTDLEPGDEVYGLVAFDRDGAAAEFVAMPASDVAAKPTTVSHRIAAALPLAGLTALQALVDHAAVQPGESVLVHGGAGGVGAMAVQLAAQLGAEVTATVRSDTAELVRGFGARHVIDVRTAAFDDADAIALPRYDVVIDTVGGQILDRSLRVLRRGGRLVTLSAPPPPGKADEYGVTATFFIVTPDREQLAELAALVDGGRLHIEIARSFPLARGRQAFESGQRPGRRAGKTVIVVRDREPVRIDDVYDLDETIRQRRSTRMFLPDPVPRQLVEESLDLAMRAPSNSNVQPWQVIFTSGAARARLVKALVDKARSEPPRVPRLPPAFAHLRSELGSKVYGSMGIAREDTAGRQEAVLRNWEFFRAPLGGIVFMHQDLDLVDSMGVGMFLQNLLLALTARGLGTCVQVSIAGYPDIIREQLGISADMRILCGLAVGYHDPAFPANSLRIGRDRVDQHVAFLDE